MTTQELATIVAELRLRRGDSADVEVKAAAGGCPSLTETLCAFANMPSGGLIILGLDERSGFVPVGLDDLATLEAGVAAQARDRVVPPPTVTFESLRFEGKDILLAHVAGLPLANRPARTGGTAYLRQSDGDYVMSEQEISQVELQKTQAQRPTTPDRGSVQGFSVSDLDPELLTAYLYNVRQSSSRYRSMPDDLVLRYTNVMAADGSPTLAGVYAMGLVPQAVSPSLGVTAAVRLTGEGTSGRVQDLVHLVGPIPVLLEAVMDWVRRNTRTTMGYDERGHGVDREELPMRAVREIVANALVHRNLDAITDSKRVEIRLLGDRLVITSPGGLWGVSERQLGTPEGKSAVNPVLYDICKNVRLPDGSRVIEGEGGGIREANQALVRAGLNPVTFSDQSVRFVAIMHRHSLVTDSDLDWIRHIAGDRVLSPHQRAVLISMHYGESWTNSRVRQEFGLDSVPARHLLADLVDMGLARKEGSRGNATYLLADGGASASSSWEQVALPATGSGQTREQVLPRAGLRETKNASVILDALQTDKNFEELVAATGLSEGQVRYGLRVLIATDRVAMHGSQGNRGTKYARVFHYS